MTALNKSLKKYAEIAAASIAITKKETINIMFPPFPQTLLSDPLYFYHIMKHHFYLRLWQ
jgi:hypothetical protein